MPGASRVPESFDTAPVRPGEELASADLPDELRLASDIAAVQIKLVAMGVSPCDRLPIQSFVSLPNAKRNITPVKFMVAQPVLIVHYSFHGLVATSP